MATSATIASAPLEVSEIELQERSTGGGPAQDTSLNWSTQWMVAIFLFLLRIPYLLIHHIQEDAFITFRTARHLAEHGELSFNLGQHFPATTSLLYPIVVAALDLVLGDRAILGIQILASLATIAGSYLVARALTNSPREQLALWILLSTWPVSALVSYTGMETPFLLLALAVAIFTLRSGRHPYVFCVAIFFMPLIRPDAVSYAVAFIVAVFILHRRQALLAIASFGCSLTLSALLYHWESGNYLPTTMSAKLNAYHPSHAPRVVLHRVFDVFLHHSFLLPVSTSYLDRLSPLIFLFFLISLYAGLRYAESRAERILIAGMASVAVAVPLVYAWGGVLFDWYLYPANWLATIVILAGCNHLARRFGLRRSVLITAGILWFAFASAQWARSLEASTQDFHYRADIGRYLHDVSKGRGTLFLEPAGYIPYYSGLPTTDEVGLVSPEISPYIQRDRSRWWIQFVKDKLPTYIVQRESFAHFQTFDGQTLSPQERRWFISHYELIRRTHYDPALYHHAALLRSILRLGPMPDYLIYRLRVEDAIARK